MPKKKKETDVQINGTQDEAPSAVPEAPVETPPEPPPNGEKKRPAAAWTFPAVAGVTVDVALWPSTIKLQSGEEIVVYNATITRSYKDASGQWQKGGSFRISEIPVLVHALLRAHAFGLDAREMNCPI